MDKIITNSVFKHKSRFAAKMDKGTTDIKRRRKARRKVGVSPKICKAIVNRALKRMANDMQYERLHPCGDIKSPPVHPINDAEQGLDECGGRTLFEPSMTQPVKDCTPGGISPTPSKRSLGISKWHRLSERKFITIRKHVGVAKVNIRDYNHSECGRSYSTKRGILLTKAEWEPLKENISSIDDMLEALGKYTAHLLIVCIMYRCLMVYGWCVNRINK